VEAVMSLLYALIRQCSNSNHFTFALHQANNSEFWCSHHRTSCTITLRITSSMSRERGRSRRGPAWHSFAARQRRRQQLERALSIARTQRTQAALNREKVRSPPMAYVEEVIPEEPLQFPLESLLFTVPENWQPPSHFSAEAIAPATDRFAGSHLHHGGGKGGSHLHRGGGIPPP
jgi:hypothetical protein